MLQEEYILLIFKTALWQQTIKAQPFHLLFFLKALQVPSLLASALPSSALTMGKFNKIFSDCLKIFH